MLNRRWFSYDQHYRQSYWMMNPNLRQCQLKRFGQSELVSCIDFLRNKSLATDRIHFAFVGDSRIRQYYYNFIKFVPDHDRPWQDPANHAGAHVSRNITAPLTGLNVSFHWMAQMDDDLFRLINRWTSNQSETVPLFLLMGKYL